jgi:hypothetical protein
MTKPKIENLTHELIANVITLALDEGSKHWYLIDNVDIETPEHYKPNKKIKYPFIDKILQGANLEIYDVENQDVKLGDLNEISIERGIRAMKDEYEFAYYNILADVYDEEDADVFLQFCVLGQYIY